MWPQIVAALHVNAFNTVSFVVATSAAVLTCLFCASRGGTDDRLGAAAFALGWIASTSANWISGFLTGDPHMPLLIGLALDGAVASAFLVLAIRFDNLWLGAAAGAQAIQLAVLALERTLSEGATSGPLVWNLVATHNALNFVMMGAMFASALSRRRRRALQAA